MKSKWTTQESLEYYLISRWGNPYFSISEKGNMTCSPNGKAGDTIDLKELVDDLCRRGIQPPILVRFNDILKSRIHAISDSFKNSIAEYGYEGEYCGVMPIKVNQQRHVVEEIVSQGEAVGLGLEAGSKPELLVAMALLQDPKALLVCNGYKDSEYVETALHAQQLGLKPFLVLDRFAELALIIRIAKRMNIEPNIGIRVKLSSKGQGKWVESSGDRSKFGLSAREVVMAIEALREANMLHCLKLLHFHIGSQITSIRSVKTATREATHFFSNLRAMGCDSLSYMDIGGGLAVDYDGSQTNFHSSMNYSTQEYANDVVSQIQEICDANKLPHPTIISESGRALVAHHAALIFNVVGVNDLTGKIAKSPQAPNDDEHNILHVMWHAYQSVSKKNFQEAYNDIVAAKDESVTLFSHGIIDLETKAHVDDMFWATCQKIARTVKNESYVPEDLQGLAKSLSDTYYCNFSVFQSLPDAWAVGHLFPVAPIHRLNEEPTREGIIADLTCDSDGKLDQFIDLRDVRDTLKLHKPNQEPYYLGAFLVGAYQEILGDLHNLFGDTNAVHVSLGEDGRYRLDHVIQGDTVSEVLGYVEYDRPELIRKIRLRAEQAVRQDRLTFEQSAQLIKSYADGLSGYTYLEDID